MTVVGSAYYAPAHLFPREAERELVSGWLRCSDILSGLPNHVAASRGIRLLANFQAADCSMSELADLIAAMQDVHARLGTLTPALVLHELRRRGAHEAIRLLPDIATYAFAPVAGLPNLVSIVRQAAKERRRLRRLQDEQAQVLSGRDS